MKMTKTILACTLLATALTGAGCQSIKSFGKSEKVNTKPVPLTKLEQPISVLSPVFSVSLPEGKGLKKGVNKKDVIDLQVTVVNGTVIAGSRSGVVSAYQGGQAVWSLDVGSPITSGVGADDSVAVVGTRTGEVVAIDVASGQILWQKALPSSSLTPALVGDDRVIMSANDGILYGLDLQSGQQVWQFSTQNPDVSVRGTAKPISLDGQTAIFGTADGRIHAINPRSGSPLWTRRIGFATGASQVNRMTDVDGSPLIMGRYLYVPSYSGQLAGFDMSRGQLMFTAELASTKSLTMHGGLLFGVSVTGDVVAFDAMSGQKAWENNELKYRKLTNPVAIGDYVAVGDLDGVIHLFDSTGKIVSRSETKGQLTSLHVIDDRLYTQTANGVLSVWQTN